MIPKEEQLDLGTQPRYTRQWGYNASTGSTSLFRRFADVFNTGAHEETRLRNQLRMRIGQGIADQYVDLAAKHHKQEMGKAAKAYYGDDLASWDPSGRVTFNDRRPSRVIHETTGGTHDITDINYNKNYSDTTPTERIGEPDTSNPKPSTSSSRRTKTTTKKTTSTNPSKPKNPAAPAEDDIKDAEIIEDTPESTTPEPTTRVVPAPSAQKKTRTPRPGKAGAVAEDPDANAGRGTKPTKPKKTTKPDDLDLQ